MRNVQTTKQWVLVSLAILVGALILIGLASFSVQISKDHFFEVVVTSLLAGILLAVTFFSFTERAFFKDLVLDRIKKNHVLIRKVKQIAEHAPFGVIICDLNADNVLMLHCVNDFALKTFHLDNEKHLGCPFKDAFPFFKNTFLIDSCHKVAVSGETFHDKDVEYSNGTDLNVSLEVYIVQSAPRQALLFFLNMTDLKMSTEKLEKKKEELDRYFLNSLDLLCIADISGNFRRLNPEWERVLGYSLNELEGRRFLDFVHPDDKSLTMDAMSDLAKGKTILNFVNRYRCKDGHYKWVEWRSFPSGELVYALARDITDKKEADEKIKQVMQEMQRVNDAKSFFVAMISHEIRTPLNGIIGFTDLLLEGHLDPEQREYAKQIEQSGETLMMLINDILDLSKMEAGHIDFEVLPINVRDFIEDACQTAKYQAKVKGLDFSLHIDDDVPKVMSTDQHRLKQILFNLLGNAIKFTKQGKISVSVTKEQQEENVLLKFSIEDTGVGIPPDLQAKLFRPFAQSDSSVARVHGGTGLGLVISKQLCQLMGGDIVVESHLGHGSIFTAVILDMKDHDRAILSEHPQYMLHEQNLKFHENDSLDSRH